MPSTYEETSDFAIWAAKQLEAWGAPVFAAKSSPVLKIYSRLWQDVPTKAGMIFTEKTMRLLVKQSNKIAADVGAQSHLPGGMLTTMDSSCWSPYKSPGTPPNALSEVTGTAWDFKIEGIRISASLRVHHTPNGKHLLQLASLGKVLVINPIGTFAHAMSLEAPHGTPVEPTGLQIKFWSVSWL